MENLPSISVIVPREVCDTPAFFKSSALTYTEAPIRGSLSSPDITTPVIVRLTALAVANVLTRKHIRTYKYFFLINIDN